MKHDFSKYSDNTMLAEFVMDIYAHQDTGEITILYDMEFDKQLLYLEYMSKTKTLDFIFKELGAIPFGDEIKSVLIPYFEKAKDVTLLHMDIKTNEAVSGMTVPLRVNKT